MSGVGLLPGCIPGDGTSGDDVIMGYGGNDVINGENGDDTLVAGPGNDTYEGGAGVGGDERREELDRRRLPGAAGNGDDLRAALQKYARERPFTWSNFNYGVAFFNMECVHTFIQLQGRAR